MASYFEEELFFLGEKSNHMVTVTPFMGKLKVHIRQFHVNEKGAKKPGKNGITLELKEFGELVKLIPKVQDSIARYELRYTGTPSSLFKLHFPVLDLDTVFLPSLPSQEPIPIIRDEERLDSQPKFPSPPPSTFPDVPTPLIEPSLENDLDDLNFYTYVPGRRRNVKLNSLKRATRSQRLKIVKQVVSLWGMLSYHLSLKKRPKTRERPS